MSVCSSGNSKPFSNITLAGVGSLVPLFDKERFHQSNKVGSGAVCRSFGFNRVHLDISDRVWRKFLGVSSWPDGSIFVFDKWFNQFISN